MATKLCPNLDYSNFCHTALNHDSLLIHSIQRFQLGIGWQTGKIQASMRLPGRYSGPDEPRLRACPTRAGRRSAMSLPARVPRRRGLTGIDTQFCVSL